MILRHRGKIKRYLRMSWVLIALASILLVAVIIVNFFNDGGVIATYSCDAEKIIVDEDGRKLFEGEGGTFLNGGTQSKEIARSGENSSRVGGKQIYGLGFELKELQPGQTVIATVWVHSTDGVGDLIADASWGPYLAAQLGKGNRETGWEQLSISVDVPIYADTPQVKFYAYCPEGIAYFDDLSIQVFERGHQQDIKVDPEDSIPEVNLIIAEKEMRVLERKRMEALRRGNLITEEDSWVDVTLETPEGAFPAKARLKGDWADHLRGKKWSFRVEMKPGYAWRRMVVFSIHTPIARSHLDEWMYHKILDKEGVLSPRYDFMVLKVNGQSRGVYAYEEHFRKQLPEFKKRREGPIVKLSETAFWEAGQVNFRERIDIKGRMPLADSPAILPFGEKRTAGDSVLRKQFEQAQTLMYQFVHSQRPIDEIFNIDKLAKYIAIVDLTQAYHGFIWHNQRWYYDPVSSKLEPVAFDGYTPEGAYKWIPRPFVGYRRNVRYMDQESKEKMYARFFLDEKFLEKYVEALKRYTAPDYMSSVLKSMEMAILKRERLISQEWSGYKYDREYLPKNAKEIHHLLYPMEELNVRAFSEGKSEGRYQYNVTNLHHLPVKITGVGTEDSESPEHLIQGGVIIGASAGTRVTDYELISSPTAATKIFYEVPGLDSTFSARIYPWSAPGVLTSRQELFKDVKPESGEFYWVEGNEIHFREGSFAIKEDIIIPEGYTVYFPAGGEYDFQKSAKFISASPVMMVGTSDAPVRVTSSDSSMRGFTVLNAEGKCVLKHVSFDHMNTLIHKGWNLTGGVTFYESNVSIDQCAFAASQCEDALNIVRCQFDLKNSTISYAMFDGLDIDFSDGVIDNLYLFTTGNDGLDFSGSTITVKGVKVENAGDKAISVGEESTITVGTMKVDGASMGAVAKDLSDVRIEMIELKNVVQGFAAYIKKPEYGPAKLNVEDYTVENVKVLHNVEQGSTLILKGEDIKEK